MTEAEIQERVAELLAKPYRKIIHGTAAEGFLAEVAELPGCMTAGDSEGEALELLRDAMAGWLAVSLEDNLPIPEPEDDEHHSGRMLVRLPPMLHGRLARQARDQGVSLNQWVVVLLAQSGDGELRKQRAPAVPVKQG